MRARRKSQALTNTSYRNLITFMEKLVYEDEIREALRDKARRYTQAEISRATGIFPTNVSGIIRGAPLSARMLKWLGYEKVTNVYRRIK